MNRTDQQTLTAQQFKTLFLHEHSDLPIYVYSAYNFHEIKDVIKVDGMIIIRTRDIQTESEFDESPQPPEDNDSGPLAA